MELDRQIHRVFQRSYQLCGRVGKKKSRHVLDTDGVGPHILDPLRDIHPVIQGVSVSQGIRKGDLRLRLLFICRLHCRLQVAKVI